MVLHAACATTRPSSSRTCHGGDLQPLGRRGRGQLAAALGRPCSLQHLIVLALSIRCNSVAGCSSLRAASLQQRAPESAATVCVPPPLRCLLTSRLAPPLNSPPKNMRAGTACTRTAWLRAWLLRAPRQAALDRTAARAAAAQADMATDAGCNVAGLQSRSVAAASTWRSDRSMGLLC